MTKNELYLISYWLEQCSDMLGNKGCNDYWLPDTDENWELIQKMQKWNSSDPEECSTRKEITSENGLFVPDFFLVSYLAHEAKNEK